MWYENTRRQVRLRAGLCSAEGLRGRSARPGRQLMNGAPQDLAGHNSGGMDQIRAYPWGWLGAKAVGRWGPAPASCTYSASDVILRVSGQWAGLKLQSDLCIVRQIQDLEPG